MNKSINGKDPEGTLNSEPINEALRGSCSSNAELSGNQLDRNLEHAVVPLQRIKDSYLNAKSLCEYVIGYDMYFCRIGFPDSYLVPGEKGKTWGRLKQIQQYNYLKRKILSYRNSDSVAIMLSYFEQFKSGNLHIHLIIGIDPNSWTSNIKNVKCELANLFELPQKNKKMWEQFFDSKSLIDRSNRSISENIENVDHVLDYLFNKKYKNYEDIDQSIFMPIWSQTSNDIKPLET